MADAPDGQVARERAVADGEDSAVLVVDGAAATKSDEETARPGRAALGQVVGESGLIDAGGALVFEGAADTVAAGAAPAVAAVGLVVAQRAVRDIQRCAGLIEYGAAQCVGPDAGDGLVVGQDALGDGQAAAG